MVFVGSGGWVIFSKFSLIAYTCVVFLLQVLLYSIVEINVSAGNAYTPWCMLSILEPKRTRWSEIRRESRFKGVETSGRNMSLWAHFVPVPKGVITGRL